QSAPETLADAVNQANNCQFAQRSIPHASHSATDPAIEQMIAAMHELITETRNANNNNNNYNRPRNNAYTPRAVGRGCYYCGKQGHGFSTCRKLKYDRQNGKEQKWVTPMHNLRGKGQPRQ